MYIHVTIISLLYSLAAQAEILKQRYDHHNYLLPRADDVVEGVEGEAGAASAVPRLLGGGGEGGKAHCHVYEKISQPLQHLNSLLF